jgi:hypothetical protein
MASDIVKRLDAAIKLGDMTGARGNRPENIYNVATDAKAEITKLRAELAACRAEREKAVAVKPLVWGATRSGYVWVALAAVGRYFIEERHSDFRWNVENWPGQWTSNTLDEAKSAAQADYEARIRAALSQPSEPDGTGELS